MPNFLKTGYLAIFLLPGWCVNTVKETMVNKIFSNFYFLTTAFVIMKICSSNTINNAGNKYCSKWSPLPLITGS